MCIYHLMVTPISTEKWSLYSAFDRRRNWRLINRYAYMLMLMLNVFLNVTVAE